ncbi:MAG: NADH-quinone oxidoreductase subunit D [Cyanobacteria bacterium NC_groundwater_1444_Ag_S-0.65um_54_12]|nr:NADH-quinone oxidoreductase subunit D [Cyanobacteria bacterium NC_groundwater_1444_Ag_S-0.65um_54_12]
MPELVEVRTEGMVLNMGPQHPSTHGVLRLLLRLDGEVIKSCTPVIGYLHRGMEKLAEHRTYVQYPAIIDRFEYLTAMFTGVLYAMCAERIAGIEVPPRAIWMRTLMLELNRIASHLFWLGTYLLDLGANGLLFYAMRDRELILNLFEEVCGARLLYSYACVGGVRFDNPPSFERHVREFLKIFLDRIRDYESIVTENPVFLERVQEVGCYSPELALQYAVSGPPLRSTGIRKDLRKDQPYLAYDQVDFAVPIGTKGDTLDRYLLRMAEMRESLKIVEQCLDRLPDGNIRVKLPNVVKIPAGEAYLALESPRGEVGAYMVANGTDKCYRLKLRCPSFNHVQFLPVILLGERISDVMAIFGSLDVILPEVDR